MRQFQACAGSHAAMHDEDEELQASGSESGAQAQDTKKKQPFLACFFCRGRKIACGPPPPESADRTCNQCARRQLICNYPLTSRRGQRRTTTAVQEDA
ncbi:hypothetical protein HETIRDRAFT_144838 [Heterobasidion irregulare TC 32-1]|uniref:Zn(2)-C6 fungal-type domain-containing protein n=1 Tax=Heterobasidion irregulare (strain TC 32-1) TaxID=747525 RepID=W4K9J9_HETIT|nr:uncharacterized protein HETIRDRAFT_144838 [Heterobasidion irregulare TC 32-1]XP_009552993.1 uncharacterized protein HETIRDRAFT_412619 [Heterobasidion irregulare TC 32-1]ETW75597.1 hypothetical protein HETIRDRAFT_412619 [Heterobasidion irregulare TC 32-1]ETW82414.1 hypothetical protein HETIRDRAFT_144838 [Heterobasidion irregulare TC 32-1]